MTTTITSHDAKARLRTVLDRATHEPVIVTRHGRPIVTVLNVELAEEALRALAGRRMNQFLRSLPKVESAEAFPDDSIDALVHEIRP